MADVIKLWDIDRLVSCARELVNEDRYSAIQIIKLIRDKEKCGLTEAKEAYLLAAKNKTLGEHQEELFSSLPDCFDNSENG